MQGFSLLSDDFAKTRSKITGGILISGAVLSVGVAPGRRRLGGFCLRRKFKLAPPRNTLSKLNMPIFVFALGP